jgi:hypothetical protein
MEAQCCLWGVKRKSSAVFGASRGSPVLSLGRQENPYLFRDLLRLFRKWLRKATMSFVMSVCLSVHKHQNDSKMALFFFNFICTIFTDFFVILLSSISRTDKTLCMKIRLYNWKRCTCWNWRKIWSSRLTDGNVQVSTFKDIMCKYSWLGYLDYFKYVTNIWKLFSAGVSVMAVVMESFNEFHIQEK